jgi:hypothetical protein
MVAGSSDPVALGQALEKITCEEICTPRQVDCGHQVLNARLLCLFLEGSDAVHNLSLVRVQIFSRRYRQRPSHPFQTLI